jgi:hypothetical protein
VSGLGTATLSFAEAPGPSRVLNGVSPASLAYWRLPALRNQLATLLLNGDFPTDLASWALTGTVPPTWQSPGFMRCSSPGAGQSSIGTQDVAVTVGKTYRVAYDVLGSSGVRQFQVGSTTGGTDLFLDATPAVGNGNAVDVVATTTIISVRARAGSAAGGTLDVDNVSVREVTASVAVVGSKFRFSRGSGLAAGSAYLLQRGWLTRGRYRLSALFAGTPGTVEVRATDGTVIATATADDTTGSVDFVLDRPAWADVAAGFTAAASEEVSLDVDVVSLAAFALATEAEVAVTGQTGIAAGAFVEAWVQAGDSTSNHGGDEHRVEPVTLRCHSVVDGVGFTVRGELRHGSAAGDYAVRWAWAPAGAARGSATLDFGTGNHQPEASVAVTGQTAIEAGAYVEAFVQGDSNADHSADEHVVETVRLRCGAVVPGTGFTVYGRAEHGSARGQFEVRWVWSN